MLIDEENYVEHYGTPRHSGRYPWGSGDEENHQTKDFLGYVRDMRRQGLSDVEIARGVGEEGITTTQLRARISIANAQTKQANINQAQRLRDSGNSYQAIADRMGLAGESSARALLAPGAADRINKTEATANMLKAQVAKKPYLDVGAGTENLMGVTGTNLGIAIAMLREEGYQTHTVNILQQGTGLETKTKVLVAPGVSQREAFLNKDKIQIVTDFSEDYGESYFSLRKPIAINPSRVGITYKEDGGGKADGVMYVRPGVQDVSLGSARYAQVRVQVGNGHYLKGMAMYKDDLPEGVDLLFNTNKTDTGNKLDALKPLVRNVEGKVDKDNPFGAVIKRQIFEPGIDPKSDRAAKPISAMNIVHEEGNWADWSKTVSTQMLSKQSPLLAKTQLNMTYEQRLKDFKEISSLTNPTVRRNLLEKFGDETDAAAVHLDAAGLSTRQGWHAILPIGSMKPSEVYAPRFEDGERVVLIRYPHGGTFEIPELIVNNKQREARKLLGDAKDAVGIHHTVAERLSGADFDGDTVLVIPNNSGKVKTTPALDGLKNFDPRAAFPKYDGMPKMTARQKGMEMGKVSNLITDMTLHGASSEHLARALRHSMVVIDAEKHDLDYKESHRVNGIADLSERYQNKKSGGASTLISRATAETRVNDRKARLVGEGGPIDKATGKRVFVETGKVDYRNGKPKQIKSTKLAETDDAHTLVSEKRTAMERVYADHSNRLKSLANEARKEAISTPTSKRNPSAAKVYDAEVKRLNSALALAKRNAPLERQAQIISGATIKAKRVEHPNMDEPTLKKVRFQALEQARLRTGASKTRIKIEQSEWDAIQAGAISESKLKDILANADVDTVRELATPKPKKLMTPNKTLRAQQMLSNGATRAEVAQQLGVSLTTLDTAMSGE